MNVVGSDNDVLVFGQPSDRDVGDDAAALVEPLGVHDFADGDGDVVGADSVEHRFAPGPLHQEVRHDRQVHHTDVLAHVEVFFASALESLAAVKAPFDAGLDAWSRRTTPGTPTQPMPEVGAVRDVLWVERRLTDVAAQSWAARSATPSR